MFSASPSQRPDPQHHLAASAHRRARQLRPHDPLRCVPSPLRAPRPAPAASAGQLLTPPSRSLSLCFPVPRALQTCPADGRRASRRRAPATSSSEYRLAARPGRGALAARPRLSPAAPAPTPHVRGSVRDPRRSGCALPAPKVGGGCGLPPPRSGGGQQQVALEAALEFSPFVRGFSAWVCGRAGCSLPPRYCGRWSVALPSAGRGGRCTVVLLF